MINSNSQSDFFTRIGIEEQDLVLQLQKSRIKYSNSSIKGQDLEIAVREFLDEWTPLNLRIGCGEVIDSLGNRSAQCDGVIVNLHQPFWKDRDSNAIFLIEAVESIFEVKTLLGTSDITDILQKAESAERLEPKHSKNDQIHSVWGPTRFTDNPPFWAIAFEGKLSTSTILQKLRDSSGALDALFVIGQGSFVNLREGTGPVQFKNSDGTLKSGWHFEEETSVLVTLLEWLHAVLPQIDRAIPVLAKYFKNPEI